MAPDLLSTIREEIDERLNELRPLMAEYEQLLEATGALVATGREDAAAKAQIGPTTRARRRTRVGAGARGSAAGAIELATAGPAKVEADGKLDGDSATRLQAADVQTATTSRRASKVKPERAAREAILAALEHGSHTVAELAVVTAMSGPNISGNLRKLVSEGVVVKTEREGKAAWALPDAHA